MPDLRALLSPASVAVIGASNDVTRLRGRLLEVMLSHAYAGKVYPVSQRDAEVQGLKAYTSIGTVPAPPDLAVIIVPARYVPEVLEDCGAASVKAAYIITSGFAEEPGAGGPRLQAEIARIAKVYDMAVAGPNAEGFANTRLQLCPTFSPAVELKGEPLYPKAGKAGPIAVVAQSGGIGFAFYDRGRPKELPFSYVVTTGNEAALEAMDVVGHLLDAGEAAAILLFLEDVKSPAKLAAAADKARDRRVPLIAVKIGRSEAGARAAASHTAALAGRYRAYRAVFRRHGIVEGADIEEMVDLAAAFAYHRDRLPAGRRVAVLTPSGGGGGWMADALSAAGLEVPPLDPATRAAIDRHLPSYGSSANPVDVTAQAVRSVGYARLLELIAASPAVDAIVVVTSARSTTVLSEDRARLAALVRRLAKPVLFYSYTQPAPEAVRLLAEIGLPLFTSLPGTARALAALADYRVFTESARPAPKRPARHRAAGAVALALAAAGPMLSEYRAGELLARYGLPFGRRRLASSAREAVAAARALGLPVALKLQSPEVAHKSEAGLVALDLASATTVRTAYGALLARARALRPAVAIEGVLVAPMAAPGVEMLLGVERDPSFGPMLTVGLGGLFVEVVADAATAPLPLDRRAARALLAELKGWPLLRGARGSAPADIEALVDLMLQLGRFALDQADRVAELELNPVRVHARGQGVSILDALIVRARAD